MGRKYFVPPDMREKEKIIGGKLTINQAAWLLLGFVIGFVVFLLFYDLSIVFGLILGIAIFVFLGGSFAFYKVNDLSLFRYLFLMREDKNKVKYLPNNR